VPSELPQADPAPWLRKADADLAAAEALLDTQHDIVLLNACSLAQQCMEKSLKALLIMRGEEPPRTHDLGRLLALLERSGGTPPDWDNEVIDEATQYAIESRYPGEIEPISRSQAEDVVRLARRVRRTMQ